MTASGLAQRLDELRRDDLHGASWVARRALEALAAIADEEQFDTSDELVERLLAAARELAQARPAASAVGAALGRVVATAQSASQLDPDAVARIVVDEANALVQRRDRAKASIAVQLRERLQDALVVTHSASATVREALVRAEPALVTCTVTRPHEEGRRFAEELRDEGVPVELVEDEEAPDVLRTCSLLLLGADTVFRDGSIVNRVGSRMLAEMADSLHVLTVVAAETLKLAPVPASQARGLEGEAAALFEMVDARLIDEVVTDDGTFAANDLAPLVDRTPLLGAGWDLVAARR